MKQGWLRIRLAAILMLSVGHLFSLALPPRDGADQQSEARKTDNKATGSPEPSPPPNARWLQPIGQPQPQTEKSKPEKPYNETYGVWEKAFAPETWSSWTLAALAFMGAFFTYHTWRALKKQVTANERAAQIAEKTLLLAERADVQIDKIQIDFPQNIPESRVVITVRNFGRTRANCIVYKFSYGFSKSETLTEGQGMPEQTLGAGGDIVFRTSASIIKLIGDDGYTKFWDGSVGKLIVKGEVTYLDVFGAEHHLRFRASLRGESFDIEENCSD
jgi:hypothetical protein